MLNLAVSEIIRKNTAEPDRPQMKVSGMHISSWVPKAADVHSESVILNPLNAELNPICHLLALLGAHHILHVSKIRVNAYQCNSGCTKAPECYG